MAYRPITRPTNHSTNLTDYKTNLQRDITLQKRAIRITSKSNYDAHTDPILNIGTVPGTNVIARYFCQADDYARKVDLSNGC